MLPVFFTMKNSSGKQRASHRRSRFPLTNDESARYTFAASSLALPHYFGTAYNPSKPKIGSIVMQRVRVTVRHNPDDPSDDLRCAARIRRDLWTHSPAEIDPDSPRHGTHRDAQSNAFFEFATDRFRDVQRVLNEYGYAERTEATVVQDENGTECVNCGNITPEFVAECPACHFREIENCPHCNHDVARLAYIPKVGDLFQCPNCQRRVRLQFQDPLFDGNGDYKQPLIRVIVAE
jgi:hypothetical protein